MYPEPGNKEYWQSYDNKKAVSGANYFAVTEEKEKPITVLDSRSKNKKNRKKNREKERFHHVPAAFH